MGVCCYSHNQRHLIDFFFPLTFCEENTIQSYRLRKGVAHRIMHLEGWQKQVDGEPYLMRKRPRSLDRKSYAKRGGALGRI